MSWREEVVYKEFTIRADCVKSCKEKFNRMYGDFYVWISGKKNPEKVNFPTGPPGLKRFKVKAKRKKKISRLR